MIEKIRAAISAICEMHPGDPNNQAMTFRDWQIMQMVHYGEIVLNFGNANPQQILPPRILHIYKCDSVAQCRIIKGELLNQELIDRHNQRNDDSGEYLALFTNYTI